MTAAISLPLNPCILRRVFTFGAALLLLCGQSPAPKDNRAILDAWLTAYNEGTPASLAQFQKEYLGNNQIAFAQDSREETGGFTLVKVEQDTPLALTALLRERDAPAEWRAILTRVDASSSRLRNLQFNPLPGTQEEAVAAVSRLATKLSAADTFVGVVAVANGEKAQLKRAWGASTDTRFYLASGGKLFTAVAVLQLVDTGKVALDDPLGKYLPNYPNAEMRAVTIRQLLTHTGGTGDMGILQRQDSANRDTVRSIADIIALNGARAPAFPPGTKWDYSNYGFLLLGAIVEKVSGEDYYDYVRRHVFEPAGMTQTSFPLREETRNISLPVTRMGGTRRSAMDQLPWRGTPAGGGVSTVDDLLKFLNALNGGKLLPPALLAEAVQRQTPQGIMKWGFGIMSSGSTEAPYWGHGGGAEGMSFVLDYFPRTGVSFACMASRDPPVCDRLAITYFFRAPPSPP